MKKIVTNNLFLIMIIAVILSIGGIKLYRDNTINFYSEERMTPDVDANYDKMKVSYVTIKERKTGLPNFDSQSDMDGHDASAADNYVRTYDTIVYTLEVGIEKNENTTTPTEILKGGKIKVKATIPSNDGKRYLSFIKDGWMQSLKLNSSYTELTATYNIPSDKLATGGTQQLSFTLNSLGYEKELTDDELPVFEVWMEGNKPDNENSEIESVTIHDTDSLIITGKVDARMSIASGIVNAKATINGISGQFINFTTKIYSPSGKGYDNPVNELSSTLKIRYRYKNLDENTGWIDLATIDGVDPINNTILYSYGRPCEPTPGFWPDSNKNKSNTSFYCAKYSTNLSNGTIHNYVMEYDSGTMNANQSDDGININFSNRDFTSYVSYPESGEYYKVLATQGFELFVPWYEPTPGRYQYEITITDTSLTVEDSQGQTYNSNPNKSLTMTFYNNLTGNFSYNLSSNTIFTDVNELPMGTKKYFDLYVNATDGPYEGGIEKLEVWNAKYVDFVPDSSNPSIYYSNSGPFDTPPKTRAKMQFGLSKIDPENGITSDEQVNASKFEDFDWYDTYQEAMEHGKITAVRTDEPDWKGYNCSSYIRNIYLKPVENINYVGKTGIIRFWAWIYGDEERTQVFTIGDETNYIGAIINEQGTGLSSNATPTGLGQTYVITGINLSVGTINTDQENGLRKTNYNVEEAIINMRITPTFNAGIADMSGVATFKVQALIPKYLSYVDGSSNYTPTSVTTNSSGATTVIWTFDNWDLTTQLPKITYQLDISPYVSNNTNMIIYAYLSSPSVVGTKQTGTSINITNLAGSSLRKTLSKDNVEIDESITIKNFIYNIAQAPLINFKTVEILPKNGDSFGSNYEGSYTLKVISLAENQKMYYTTNPINNIGLSTDSLGRNHIQTVDLENDNRWQEIMVNDTIPENATAIATYIPEIASLSDVEFKLQFIPVGNTYQNLYYFQLLGSSDNLENAVMSGIKQVGVIDRQISGFVFLDKNNNGKYDTSDQLLANKTVKLYDSNDNLIREMTTDENGKYETSHLLQGSYYIKYELELGMEFVNKNVGTADVSSIINIDTGKSDIIQELNENPTSYHVLASNKNIGVKYKTANIVVHHYLVGTTTKVHDDNTMTKNYNETYETNYYAPGELYSTYRNKYSYKYAEGDETSGVINKNNYEIIYYYDLRSSTITVHHYITGTTTKVHEDNIIEKHYTETYSTTYYQPEELEGEYKDIYRYKNRVGDNFAGTVNKDSYEITYYYELKPSTIVVHHYIEGTTTRLHSDDVISKRYTETYETSYYQPTDFSGGSYNAYRYKSTAGDPTSGVANKDRYEVIYYYELKPAVVTVHHYIVGTTTKVHTDDIINTKYTQRYSTNYYNSSELEGIYKDIYQYKNRSGDNASGTVSKDNYEVIYYYEAKQSEVVVHHYIQGTTTKVQADEVLNMTYGQNYETNSYPSEELWNTNYYYRGVHGGDDSAGVINKDNYEITYYYELKPATVTVHHYINGTTTKVHEDDVIYSYYSKYYETSTYETSELAMLYKNLYVYNETHTGDKISGPIIKDNYEINYYYDLKPAKITVHHYIDGTTEKLCDDKIYNLKYTEAYEVDSCLNLSNINYVYKKVVNGGDGEQNGSKITGNIMRDSIEIIYYYELKPGHIIVHYIEAGTDKRIIDDILGEGLVNNIYTVEPKIVPGYKLVKKPDTEKYFFKEDTQEVIYEYERIKYNIKVEVVGGVGTITGSEEVAYGDDSTPNKIVITPGEGYEVEKILVNGKEINLETRGRQTLGNFRNVKKDISVQVSFREQEMKVPITSKFSRYVVIAIILIGFSVIGFVYYKYKTNY